MSTTVLCVSTTRGATVEGRPYFAMEYGQEIPHTEYCDKVFGNTSVHVLECPVPRSSIRLFRTSFRR